MALPSGFSSQDGKGKELPDREFSRLYEENLVYVFNYCMFRLRDHEKAEGATQDSFQRAWVHHKSFNPTLASFKTWIIRIAANIVIDMVRKGKNHPIVALEEDFIDPLQDSPEAEIEEKQKLESLNHSMRKVLTDYERELIALKLGAEMSNREISKLLNRDESAVGSALHRALQKIKKANVTEAKGMSHD